MQIMHRSIVYFVLQYFFARPYKPHKQLGMQKMLAINLFTSVLTIIGFNSLIGYTVYAGALA